MQREGWQCSVVGARSQRGRCLGRCQKELSSAGTSVSNGCHTSLGTRDGSKVPAHDLGRDGNSGVRAVGEKKYVKIYLKNVHNV